MGISTAQTQPIAGYRTFGPFVIALGATGFNLLFEWSLRGLAHYGERPLLPFFLVLQYFTFFLLLDDLVRRHRLNDLHVLAITAVLGVLYQSFVSGAAFRGNVGLAGINWGGLAFVIFIWWLPYQAVLAMYTSTRLFPRDWQRKPLPGLARIALLLLNLGGVALFAVSGIPRGRPISYVVMGSLLLIAIGVALWSMPRKSEEQPAPERRPRWFFDLLAGGSVLLMLVCMVLPGRSIDMGGWSVNGYAVLIMGGWTLLCALFYYGFRLYTKQAVMV